MNNKEKEWFKKWKRKNDRRIKWKNIEKKDNDNKKNQNEWKKY